MPVYEFACYDCKKIDSVETTMEKADKIKPPKCGNCKKKMDRLYGGSFILQGRGWPSLEGRRFPGNEYHGTHMPRDTNKHYKD